MHAKAHLRSPVTGVSFVAHGASLRAALGLAVLLAIVAPPARADVIEAWAHHYANVMSNSVDQPRKVVRDGAGDVIVIGQTDDGIHGFDLLTIKYSGTDGSVLWQKRYNGPANRDDYASAVAVDGAGNVVVTGSSSNGSSNDYYTAKYAAADGALLWEKRFHRPANSGDSPPALAVDGSGNAIVAGSSVGESSNDYYTAKYAAADGAVLWEKRYNGPVNNDDQARAVAVDSSGNVVVTGYSVGGFLDLSGDPRSDFYTARYAAADGALLWEKRGPSGKASAVTVDGAGNVVVTGPGAGVSGYYTAKYAAADGARLWEKRYQGPEFNYDFPSAVAADGSGNVVVTGFSASQFTFYCYTAKYAAADGALLWEKRYHGPANEYESAVAVAVDGSGNVVVTGSSTQRVPNFESDYYTAKYAAADGALLWERRYNGPANGDDRPQAMVMDGSGNVIVTGTATVKYAATDGALLWEKGGGLAVAVDGSGNVIVTGTATVKYAAADGAPLWEKDGGSALAVDASGNVIVTGTATVKYGAADGALLWKTAGGRAVAVDGSGNVIVAASSGDYPNRDYYTAKYASVDGALLWEKRYNGPAKGDDTMALRGLALGPNGMIVITGSSDGNFGAATTYGYGTVVYREKLAVVGIEIVAAGVSFRFNREPGHRYQVQRASAVTGPWSTLLTLTATDDGRIEYTDTDPPARGAYYRTSTP